MHRGIASVRPNRIGKLSDSNPSTQRLHLQSDTSDWGKTGEGWARRAKGFGILEDTLEELSGSPTARLVDEGHPSFVTD
jgi:hypothetical protein